MPTELQNPELALALSFSPEDLISNRNGVLSTSQRMRVRDSMQLWQIFHPAIAITVIITIALAIWDGNRIGDSTASRAGIIGLIILLAIAASIYVRYKWKQLYDDWNSGHVSVIEGRLILRKNWTRHGWEFWAKVGKKKFRVPRHVFDGLREGKDYRFYYLRRSNRVMSAEEYS